MTSTTDIDSKYIEILNTYINNKSIDQNNNYYLNIIVKDWRNFGTNKVDNFIIYAEDIINDHNKKTANDKLKPIAELSIDAKKNIISEFILIVYRKVSIYVNNKNIEISSISSNLFNTNDQNNLIEIRTKINANKVFADLGFDILNVYIEFKLKPVFPINPTPTSNFLQSSEEEPTNNNKPPTTSEVNTQQQDNDGYILNI